MIITGARARLQRLSQGAGRFRVMTLVWQEARKQAIELTRDFGTSDPYFICRQLGIDVFETALPAGVSGMIVKEHDENAQVFVDSADVPRRRRFTCAHELGHFIERMNVAGDREFSFRDLRGSSNYDLHEFFADEFAGELIMPASKFLALERAGASLTMLATEFDVTVKAVERRSARLQKNPPR